MRTQGCRWATRRLKYLARLNMGQSPSSGDYVTDPKDGVPFLQGAAEFTELHPVPRIFCRAPTKIASRGDILLSVRAPVGQLNIANDEVGIGRGLCAVAPREDLDASYAWWALHESRHLLNRVATGSTYDAVAVDDVGNLHVTLPPLPRQRAIAAYLDSETAKIDTMIAAKVRLLALLAEKRRALITHAVTRGLNPDAPMKDSGVEWLGEIPEVWTLTRLKFLAEIRGGVTLGKSYGNRPLVDVPYLRVANVQAGRVDLHEVKTISVPTEERDRYLLRAGDLLMTEGGDIDKLGRGCVWLEQISPCMHQNHVFAVRPHHVDPEWLARWTDADPSRAYFEITAKRSTNLASISGSNIGELPVLVPPEAETGLILSHIEHGTAQLDALSECAVQTIQVLRERRTALIVAAVTGQVDVETAACE